jgi:putative component of membrane protein insertase Oxa1/YidC/SpoIIIJ protein YidD
MMLAIPSSPGGAVAASLIAGYQRFISPYKGFRCAHRACHGRASCSEFARRVAIKRGVVAMFVLLRKRFAACADAAKRLSMRRREKRVLDCDSNRSPAPQVSATRRRDEPNSCGHQLADAAGELAVEAVCQCGPELACSPLDGI